VKSEGNESLSRLARELLAAERTAVEPPQIGERALRRARRVMQTDRPSGADTLSVLSPRAAGARSRAFRSTLVIAAALAVAGIAVASASYYDLFRPADTKRPTAMQRAPQARPTAFTPVAAADANPAQKNLTPTPTASSAGAEPVPAAASSTRAPSRLTSSRQYALEVQLLEPARSGIARRDYAGALQALARHQREFPNGQLAEERAALRVRALWGVGRAAEAEAAAAAFRLRYPRSALLGGLQQPSSRTP
jgi:hypothetical protein